MYSLRVPNLQSYKQGDSLYRIVTSIYKISHEEVVGEGDVSSNREQFDEVMQLSMYISADSDWNFDGCGIGLLRQDSDASISDQFNLFFCDGFEVSEVIDNDLHFHLVRHIQNIYPPHPSNRNSMLSDKEIRSMIWDQYQPGDEEEGQGAEGEQVLDLSHQELRKLREFQLKKLDVQRVNASYNFFKDFVSLNFAEFKEQAEEISIRWLDVSFNFIRQIDQTAQSCHILKFLRYLNISANQLQSVDFSALDLPLLKTLNLNNNKIKYFLHCPEQLKVLTINDNQLTSLAFTGGQTLNILTAKKNMIKEIGLQLEQLSVFDIESNRMDDIDVVREFLKKCPNLLAINFRDNPVGKAKDYRIAVLENCPEVGQIDDILISPHIRQGFKILKAEEQLNDLLDKVNTKYEMKLAQKQKIKKDLIKKIRAQQKLVEDNYYKGIKEERQQFQILEKKTHQKLAKKKLGAPSEKHSLSQSLRGYADELQQIVENQGHTEKAQRQNKNEYLDFLNKNRPYSSSKQPPEIRRVKTREIQQTDMQILPDIQGIKLFDLKAVDYLIDIYNVKMVDF